MAWCACCTKNPSRASTEAAKHNNYALSTDTGVNLLDPGDTPSENAQFLVFLSAIIAAVDDYQDLMRVAVASAGNDHRLGANEAPPAIISIFLGDELNEIIESIVNASKYEAHERDQMKLGVHILPRFPRIPRTATAPRRLPSPATSFEFLDARF